MLNLTNNVADYLVVIVYMRTIIIMFREFSNSYRLIKLHEYELQLLKVCLTV